MLRKLLSLVIAIQLGSFSAFAQNLDSGFVRAEDVKGAGQGNIFVSGKKEGGVLIKVNLWGAVNKSGIHYIPHETDFVSLLSYAGGPSSKANLESAYIKRRTKDAEEIIPVNIKDIVGVESAHNPLIQPNDIIVVPEYKPTIDQDTVVTIGFVSTILSVVLASFVLKNELQDD